MKKYIIFLFILTIGSCTSPQEEEIPIAYNDVKDTLQKWNKINHAQEILDIEAYIKRHGWKNVQSTGSGLYYVIYKKVDTNQVKARPGLVARINYTITLLNDTVCYSSEGKPDDFVIGMDNVESGLHEGITYMRKGEKAKILMTSNMAAGLVGDMDQIPPQSSLIFDIELVDLIDPATKRTYVEPGKKTVK
ncbi:MAG TPA: FKBP-type peptidyl-prolyl cis-trans isomerase [Flavobacteriales bacterium]|nr:FKBP-type peptidyl-prolyl cis-trans isomerase [Flavobacteriales bacterium]